MRALVGYTGFVGSNLADQADFEGLYNSGNIESAFDTKPELLVFSGIRAEKFLANSAPEKDYEIVRNAADCIRRIAPQKLVLISTIDVYKTPVDVDEKSPIDTHGLHPYGLNRFHLEEMARDACPDALVVRLPGLFGKNIKKNFIYDMIHLTPSMLSDEKLRELGALDPQIPKFYEKNENGYFHCRPLDGTSREYLKTFFSRNAFNALSFTDSRAVFQFYNLSHLWGHIQTALSHGLTLLNLATPPMKAADIYREVNDSEFLNELPKEPPYYDFRTQHAALFGASNGYIIERDSLQKELAEFICGAQ